MSEQLTEPKPPSEAEMAARIKAMEARGEGTRVSFPLQLANDEGCQRGN